MTLVPPQGYLNIQYIHRRGLAAARPNAADVVVGTLYYSSDTGTLERSNGATWDLFATGGTSIISASAAQLLSAGADFDDSPQVPLIGSDLVKYSDFNPTFLFDVTFNQQLLVLGNTAFTGAINLLLNATSIDNLEVVNAPLLLDGGQIRFPAAQNPSAGANDLDDYEKGTFTPTLTGSGGSVGQTYSLQNGYYVKIGRKIFVMGYVILTALGTITGNAQIGGMPYTSVTAANFFSGLDINWFSNWTSTFSYLGSLMQVNSTKATFTSIKVPAASMDTVVQADMANASEFIFSGSYIGDN